MPVTGAFPYDISNLLDGPMRVLVAPIAQAIPDSLNDIFLQVTPYTAAATWVDVGATAGPFSVGHTLSAASYNIQQTTLAVRKRVNESGRTAQISIAEFNTANLKMIEEGGAIDTNAAATGVGASKSVPIGTITELTQYRLAAIGQRGKDQGIVTETGAGTPTRGRFFGFIAYRVQLAPESYSIALGEGDLANADVTFELLPDPSITTAGEEHGFWIFEDAGTLT